MNDALAMRRKVARWIGQALASHENITALLVFGSVASGAVDDRSDIDMLAVCQPEILIPTERERLLATVGTGWILSALREDSLFSVEDRRGIVEGIQVEIAYHSTMWIDAVVREVVEHGAITTVQQPFRPYTLIALLQRASILFDKEDRIAAWRELARPYPSRLKQNILRHFIPVLQEETADLVASADRKIGPGVFLFHLNRAVDAMHSILYALNETYDPADRRAGQLVLPYLSNVPDRFTSRLTAILEGPFTQDGSVIAARSFMHLSEEVIGRTGDM